MADDYQDDDQSQDDTQGDATQAVAQAAPEEVDAHRGLLSEVLGQLGGQGVNVQSLLGQAGVGTTDPSQMSHGDLVSTTLVLARSHPEVVTEVANRFPEAGGLLNDVLGAGGQGGSGGGMLGGLLGRFGL
ncbi:MAG: hypothetical protein ACRYFS_09335 [Janthinobacterium lividum]